MKSISGKLSRITGLLILVCTSATSFGCFQPVLESAECIESREPLKKFYSFHIGNEMTPSVDYMNKRRKFISGQLITSISENLDDKRDYFTQTDDYPKAFRAGACENLGKARTRFEVLLFWRTEEKNIQRSIAVETIKDGGNWLIDKVSPKE